MKVYIKQSSTGSVVTHIDIRVDFEEFNSMTNLISNNLPMIPGMRVYIEQSSNGGVVTHLLEPPTFDREPCRPNYTVIL